MNEYAGLISAFVQLVGFLVGGIVIAASMRSNLHHLQTEVADLKGEIKKLADILTKIAVQEQRLNYLEAEIHDLRRGRGYIIEDRLGATAPP